MNFCSTRPYVWRLRRSMYYAVDILIVLGIFQSVRNSHCNERLISSMWLRNMNCKQTSAWKTWFQTHTFEMFSTLIKHCLHLRLDISIVKSIVPRFLYVVTRDISRSGGPTTQLQNKFETKEQKNKTNY